MNFALMQYHKWTLEAIESMLPWEREIYTSLLINYLNERAQNEQKISSTTGLGGYNAAEG